MSTSKIVSWALTILLLRIDRKWFRRCLTAGPVIVSGNCVSSPSCRTPRYASRAVTLNLSLNTPPAVRKNRYVILPIDFEDAWKVCLSLFGLPHVKFARSHFFTANCQEVGRDSRVLWVFVPHSRIIYSNRLPQIDEDVVTIASRESCHIFSSIPWPTPR